MQYNMATVFILLTDAHLTTHTETNRGAPPPPPPPPPHLSGAFCTYAVKVVDIIFVDYLSQSEVNSMFKGRTINGCAG